MIYVLLQWTICVKSVLCKNNKNMKEYEKILV